MRYFLFFALSLFADLEHHLKKIPKKIETSSIEGVDYLYLINLDARPERWKASMEQLLPYGILPQRFSAIYGWHLPFETYQETGLVFRPGMWIGPENAVRILPDGSFYHVRLGEQFYGETVFSGWLTPGALGCTLSHLSVLQDAWDSGYETIWILEDDFQIFQNPHLLSPLLKMEDGWDILYTDPNYLTVSHPEGNLQEQMPYKWRPDFPHFDLKKLLERTPVGDHFYRIGNRIRTHSMIIRRSGIKKILDFYKEKKIFLPYDHELGFIPNLILFTTRENFIDAGETTSDTKHWHF
jgi:GR25 family glycosyltransferase involved in LPS biosynthesis